MTMIYIKYDPYKVETTIVDEDVDLTDSGILSQYKNEPIENCIEQIIFKLDQEIVNLKEFTIKFHGIASDYEKITQVVKKYNVGNDMNIKLKYSKAIEASQKAIEISELLEYIQTGPFEELRDKRIWREIENEIGKGEYIATTNIKNAVVLFKASIGDQQMIQNLNSELRHDQKEYRKLQIVMKEVDRALINSEKAKAIESKVLDIDITEDIESVRQEIRDMLKVIADRFDDTLITKSKAVSTLEKCEKQIEQFQVIVWTNLGRKVKIYMMVNAERLIDEYKTYVSDIVDTVGLEDVRFNQIRLTPSILPNTDNLITKNMYVKEELIESEKVQNKKRVFRNIFPLLGPINTGIDIYKSTVYVDGEKLKNEFVGPIKQPLEQNLNSITEHFEQQKKTFHDKFVDELKLLDKKVLAIVEKSERLEKRKQVLGKKIKLNEENKKWLDNLIGKLDSILGI